MKIVSTIVQAILAIGLLALVAAGCARTTTQAPSGQVSVAPVPKDIARPDMLVDTVWLSSRLNDSKVRIIDVRAADKYQESHVSNSFSLPSALFTSKAGRMTNELPAPEQFAEVMGSMGVKADTQIVIYDEGNGLTASRLYWTLDYFGHPKISLLNGGFGAWTAESREVTKVAPSSAKTKWTPKPDPSKLATKELVLAVTKNKAASVLDSRSAKEYTGEDKRADRGGRIVGAVNVDWATTVATVSGVSSFRSGAEIRGLFEQAGLKPDQEIITYCQSGVRAAHAYFTLKLNGYKKVRNYDGSWEEWGNDPQLPMETGPAKSGM
ncbi:MAG: sulfurtransferase [Chloroflexi bacterium]|nr:sulfurtransferase [Chloroflexota bacterium]